MYQLHPPAESHAATAVFETRLELGIGPPKKLLTLVFPVRMITATICSQGAARPFPSPSESALTL